MFTVHFKVHELQSRRAGAVTAGPSFFPERRHLGLSHEGVLVGIAPVVTPMPFHFEAWAWD
jgi:hypothetical protein